MLGCVWHNEWHKINITLNKLPKEKNCFLKREESCMRFFVFRFVPPYLKHILNKNRSLFCNVTSIFFSLITDFNWHKITWLQMKIINLIHCSLHDKSNHFVEIYTFLVSKIKGTLTIDERLTNSSTMIIWIRITGYFY